jgi:hypothetical protein
VAALILAALGAILDARSQEADATLGNTAAVDPERDGGHRP